MSVLPRTSSHASTHPDTNDIPQLPSPSSIYRLSKSNPVPSTDNMAHNKDENLKGNDQEPASPCGICRRSPSLTPPGPLYTNHVYNTQSSFEFLYKQRCSYRHSSPVANTYRIQHLDENTAIPPITNAHNPTSQQFGRIVHASYMALPPDSEAADSTPLKTNLSSQDMATIKYPESPIRYSYEERLSNLSGRKYIGHEKDLSTIHSFPKPMPTPSNRYSRDIQTKSLPHRTSGSLSQCQSVLDLLCSVYDLVVIHQMLCERDTLHRDINWQNVVLNPMGGTGSLRHIDAILNLSGNSPRVQLRDLDYGMVINKGTGKSPLDRPVGTPMFIPLEVAGAHPIKRAPEISSLARHVQSLQRGNYLPDKVVSPKFFETFSVLARNYQSRHIQPKKINNNIPLSEQHTSFSDRANVDHEPRHDVESIFWLLCFALARANPKSAAHHPAEVTMGYFNFCRYVVLEEDTSQLREKRGWYLGRTETKWKEILHPDLAAASTLLHHMGRYLAIRTYDAKCEAWDDYHAHDMLKLLLFSAIQTFRSNPVPLCTHTPRYSPPSWNDYIEITDSSTTRSYGNDKTRRPDDYRPTATNQSPLEGSNKNACEGSIFNEIRTNSTCYDPWYTNGKLEACQVCLFEQVSQH
ncbi:hypothetical protein CPB86DRAFT_812244 [Serendipita vermifera]|nr:hypothetical protein CPB86DRAFT_812244 [Serendipita vermifera]